MATVVLYVAVVGTFHARRDALAAAPPLTISRTPSVPGEASLLFAGDTALIDAALPTLFEHGMLYAFGSTMDLLRGADVAVVNLETPISDGDTPFPLWKDFTYVAPSDTAQAMADAGIDVVTLANNHALDYRAEGLTDTLSLTAKAGMAAIGAGRDAAEARRGVIVDVGGLRVGLLAYCQRQWLWDFYIDLYARTGHAGAAPLAEPDLDRDVARLRAAGAALVVVALHAGDNYARPERAQLAWARRAVDAGADLVVEHHPHVAQPVALYRGRAILLSLGNFAFGTRGRFPRQDGPDFFDAGLVALAHARRCPGGGAAFDRLELVPLAVQNDRVRYRPEPLHDAERATLLARLAAASSPLGATVAADGAVALPGCAR